MTERVGMLATRRESWQQRTAGADISRRSVPALVSDPFVTSSTVFQSDHLPVYCVQKLVLCYGDSSNTFVNIVRLRHGSPGQGTGVHVAFR